MATQTKDKAPVAPAEPTVDEPVEAPKLDKDEIKDAEKVADQQSEGTEETTVQSASVPIGNTKDFRKSGDNPALGHEALPRVAGPNASDEDRARAVRSQGPSGRTALEGKTKISLRSGGSVTVAGDASRTEVKLRNGGIVQFHEVDDKGKRTINTVNADDVAKVEAA